MPTVALVRLRHAPKEYWFDPGQAGAQEGDHVLVETNRGREIGMCVEGAFEVDARDVKKPLKPIVRVATEADIAQAEEMAAKGTEAMRAFRSLVDEEGLDMKPVTVDYLFDGKRATFYYTSEERVDFRQLVRDLASRFHIRVDMRQIGARDEARMVGGLGHCGEELCCRRLGGEFHPVGIRMAKDQDLSLNPAKISGLCGRLMCCLRYEYEAYKDFKGRAPKKNALIETPQGLAKVIEFDTPRERVRVRFEDGSTMDMPIASLDTGDKVPQEGQRLRPCHISKENFDKLIEELHHDETLAMMGDKLFSENPELADKEAEAGAIERNPHRRRRNAGGQGRGSRGAGEGGRGGQRGRRRGESGTAPKRDQRKRRRSVSATVEGEPHRRRGDSASRAGAGSNASGSAGHGSEGARPGEHNRNRNQSHNRNRRRRHDADGPARGGREGQGRNEGRDNSRDKSKPRPGQHSSTVSGDAAHGGQHGSGANRGQGGNRKRRRRHRSGGNKPGQGQGQGSSPENTKGQ